MRTPRRSTPRVSIVILAIFLASQALQRLLPEWFYLPWRGWLFGFPVAQIVVFLVASWITRLPVKDLGLQPLVHHKLRTVLTVVGSTAAIVAIVLLAYRLGWWNPEPVIVGLEESPLPTLVFQAFTGTEELLYRGLIYSLGTRLGAEHRTYLAAARDALLDPAVLTSSAAFAAASLFTPLDPLQGSYGFDWSGGAVALLAGYVLGLVRRSTDSTYASVAVRAGSNVVVALVAPLLVAAA